VRTRWFISDSRSPIVGAPKRIHFEDEADLERVLSHLTASEHPGVVGLYNGNQSAMRLGMHRPYGFAQFFERGSPYDGLIAVAKHVAASSAVEFSGQGVGEPVRPQNLIEWRQLVALALEFYRSGGRCPDSVSWEKRR
jgi:hypothetical protein